MALRPGFPIRKSADQSLFAAPRGLSQRITSFIASQRQGIHQMPFETLDRPYTKAGTGTTRPRLAGLAAGRFAYDSQAQGIDTGGLRRRRRSRGYLGCLSLTCQKAMRAGSRRGPGMYPCFHPYRRQPPPFAGHQGHHQSGAGRRPPRPCRM